MIEKRIQPESFDFGVPSVEIVGATSKGLDKTAMVKRASVFEDVLDTLEKKAGHTYLHVITTGAGEFYGANLNGDYFNETECNYTFPEPKEGIDKTAKLDGGLKKYHDKTYSTIAKVYQEHKSNEEAGDKPSGIIKYARYNDTMHRGELIIEVENEAWAPRLQKKANGENIYLSMGCKVPYDTCGTCGHIARTMAEHCDHFKLYKGELTKHGNRNFVLNDAPRFDDISGVDVPADRIAFVLSKVANAETGADLTTARYSLGVRQPMLLTKAASILGKLAEMEKEITARLADEYVEDSTPNELSDDPETKKKLVIKVQSFPADEVIDGTIRKGILLTPDTLFKILGNDDGCGILKELGDDCCGDLSTVIRELLGSDNRNEELLDGSFDTRFPGDLHLDRILDDFVEELSCKPVPMGVKTIRITIRVPEKARGQNKKASLPMTKEASEALRRTYARYLVSFAERNDDETCRNALRKLAYYSKDV